VPTESSANAPRWIERLKSVRFPENDEAQIQLTADPTFQISGFVRDANSAGLRLALPEPLAPGLEIRIILTTGTVLHGEIRYCRFAATTYYAGVLLRPSVASFAA
jgi:hypothetical protein